MSDIIAGRFELLVSGPHPCWVEITYEGKRLASIHHSEIADLRYALDRARQEARLKLGERYRDEVL